MMNKDNDPIIMSDKTTNIDQMQKKYNMTSRSRLSFDRDRYKDEDIALLASSPPRNPHSDESSAASQVFHIPELLELILLSLPCDTTHQEVSSARTILLAQTTTHTWHALLTASPQIRQQLYLPTSHHQNQTTSAWHTKSAFPPAAPNPWTPTLLLKRRSWGSSYPFTHPNPAYDPHPTQPKHWTYNLEIDRAQASRFPPSGPWREMLATQPPLTDFWYTRCFYELGSGRAPFVEHWDYEPKVGKAEQRYRVHCASGITLGMIADAVGELFGKYANARWVMVESFPGEEGEGEEGPVVKGFMPGSSAEREYGWYD